MERGKAKTAKAGTPLPQWGKALLAASVAGGILLGGFRLASAWVVPGWDRPGDPSNYYSPTSISWADTANPSFFYRDLGWQGGQVYDMTRDIKSALFGDNFIQILAQLAEKLGIDIVDHQPWDEHEMREIGDILKQKAKGREDIYILHAANDITDSALFHRYDESNLDASLPRDKAEQRTAIALAATDYATAAQTAIQSSRATGDAISRLLDAAAKAEGETELRQIKEQLEALAAAERQQTTALIGARIQLKASQQREELDEELAHEARVQAVRVQVSNPFDAEAEAASGFERPAPKGFVPFE